MNETTGNGTRSMDVRSDGPAHDALGKTLQGQRYPEGALYVVATPIGNLADLGLRALDVLRRVNAVAAEDTRHTRPMLDRIGVAAPLIACHEHNEREAAQRVLARLAAGERVAYVSDAGTPGISDPGARLVATVRAAGHPVVPVPGPSAVATALSVAGFDAAGFHFAGFLPPKAQARAQAIQALANLTTPLVFYEAPHRIAEAVRALADGLGGERRIVLCRELTKLHEQIHACPLGAAADWLAADDNRRRGEFVLVVEGRTAQAPADAEFDRVLEPLVRALPLKQAVALAVDITGAPRNAVYARALALKRDDADAP